NQPMQQMPIFAGLFGLQRTNANGGERRSGAPGRTRTSTMLPPPDFELRRLAFERFRNVYALDRSPHKYAKLGPCRLHFVSSNFADCPSYLLTRRLPELRRGLVDAKEADTSIRREDQGRAWSRAHRLLGYGTEGLRTYGDRRRSSILRGAISRQTR